MPCYTHFIRGTGALPVQKRVALYNENVVADSLLRVGDVPPARA
ncbi:hypothetical protein AAC978_12125 [Desulfitobacterium sp. THU1]